MADRKDSNAQVMSGLSGLPDQGKKDTPIDGEFKSTRTKAAESLQQPAITCDNTVISWRNLCTFCGDPCRAGYQIFQDSKQP